MWCFQSKYGWVRNLIYELCKTRLQSANCSHPGVKNTTCNANHCQVDLRLEVVWGGRVRWGGDSDLSPVRGSGASNWPMKLQTTCIYFFHKNIQSSHFKSNRRNAKSNYAHACSSTYFPVYMHIREAIMRVWFGWKQCVWLARYMLCTFKASCISSAIYSDRISGCRNQSWQWGLFASDR